MAKSSLSDVTTRRPKESFDPALAAPVTVTPDQLEKVVGGLAILKLRIGGGGGGTTTGAVPPPFELPSLLWS
jgi:hypothetical protein